MKKGAKILVGTHNFSTFRAANCGAKSPIRTIKKIQILKSKKQILLNEDLMQLDNVDISGQVKLKVLEKYDENDIVINKMDFMKILLKYKVVNNFGNINDWLKSTFGNIISK